MFGTKSVGVGARAPEFALPDQAGATVRLADLLSRGCLVLFFYPKDFTPICTAEACAFRDSYEVFTAAGAEVVGISSDGRDAHEAFATQHRLPFRILTDAGGATRAAYGVPSALLVLPGRTTYVIDREGVVRHVFSSQLGSAEHVADALQAVRALTGKPA